MRQCYTHKNMKTYKMSERIKCKIDNTVFRILYTYFWMSDNRNVNRNGIIKWIMLSITYVALDAP